MMSQLIRRPDGMRYVDSIEQRTAALERRQAGELESRLAAVEADVAVKGRLIDVQKVVGQNNAYRALGNGAQLTVNAANTIPLQSWYTPPIDVWWEAHLHIGILNKTDAAYHYSQPNLTMNTPDADGFQTATNTITQHSAVQQYESHNMFAMFKLTAGVAYSVYSTVGFSGGTWQYYQGANTLNLVTKAWAR